MNKFVYETDDENKIKLIINIDKVNNALKNIKEYYKTIYDGNDCRDNKKYYYKGSIYTLEELLNKEIKIDDEKLFGCMPIYTEEEILIAIKKCLDEIWDIIG